MEIIVQSKVARFLWLTMYIIHIFFSVVSRFILPHLFAQVFDHVAAYTLARAAMSRVTVIILPSDIAICVGVVMLVNRLVVILWSLRT